MTLSKAWMFLWCVLLPACATAQTSEVPPAAAVAPAAPAIKTQQAAGDVDIPEINRFCATQMISLADASLEGRHQFYVLVREAGRGANNGFLEALDAFGAQQISRETPVLQVVEDTANPVLLQAAPAATVSQMAYLIGFSNECADLLEGQIVALEATSPGLASGTYKQAIGEDAMFLRSMLLDALYRLNADSDPRHGQAIAAYQRDLVDQRDDIEFAAFDAELAALEDEFAGDLDRRLDLANTAVGENAEAVDAKGAAAVARALSDVQRAEANQRMARILAEVLNGYSISYSP
ncbi:MAG: hypothetical protein AAFO57_01505 [Pseudomonadota bacterium]